MKNKITQFGTIIFTLALACLAGHKAQASNIITTPYNGADLLWLTTANNASPNSNSPGGISTPGAGTQANPAGVNYLIQDGDGGPVAMFDANPTAGTWGPGDGNGKFFSGGMNNPTSVPMGSLSGSANPTQTSGWKWFDAHFTDRVVISHFVLRTADHAFDRTPDQFQLRGSNDGGSTWDVIFRYDNNASNGSNNPWGTVSGSTPVNFTAVQFDGSGADFATPAAYNEVRMEIFSVTQGDGAGITELQLAGTAVPEPGTAVSLLGGLGMLVGLRRRRA